MNLMLVLLAAAVAFAVSGVLTGSLRRYALARQILDVPGARSSHVVATPRGGGMAIVATTLVAIALLAAFGLLSTPEAIGWLTSGALVGSIGFLDDHRHMPAAWRLLGHFVAAGILLAAIGPPRVIAGVHLPWLWYAVGAFYVVWMLNLTNFMDGIDGIAAVEAITVCLGAIVLYAVSSGPSLSLVYVPLLLAASTAGFLWWNWPPARIFMGDGGSGFVGLMLAALSLDAGRDASSLLWGWLILLSVFTTDATLTLLRRAWRGERVHEPHRTHAYQHAAVRFRSHKAVTLTVAAINLLWLLPLATAVSSGHLNSAVGVALAYGPLVVAAWVLGAGIPPSRSEGPPPGPQPASGQSYNAAVSR